VSESVELLQSLIRNACVNDGGAQVSEVANARDVVSILEGSGVDIEVYDSEPERRSVITRLPGTNPTAPTLMLLAHTDVVPAQSDRWKRDPFGGELIDGFVWGRGALDMLGHVSTMSIALRDYARAGVHHGGDIVLAAVADEEALSTKGVGWLLNHEADAMQADWVVTETGGSNTGSKEFPKVVSMTGEKGAWRLRVTVRGNSIHSSIPYGSEGTPEVAAEVIRRISEYEHSVIITPEWKSIMDSWFEEGFDNPLLDSKVLEKSLPRMPLMAAKNMHALSRMTTVVTSISGIGSWNTVPAEITLELDVRTLVGQSREDIFHHLQEALGPRFNEVSIEVIAGGPASWNPTGSPLWELMTDAARVQLPGAKLQPIMATGATDARFYRHNGAMAYGFGLYSDRLPTNEISSMLHGNDERVDVESIAMMEQLWGSMFSLFAERTRG